MSRSPTIVISYLMCFHKMRLRDAYKHVKDRRPIVKPNMGTFLSSFSAFLWLFMCYELRYLLALCKFLFLILNRLFQTTTTIRTTVIWRSRLPFLCRYVLFLDLCSLSSLNNRFIILLFYYFIALALIALSLYRFIALSLYRFIALSLYRFIALSLYRFIALSLYRFIALSLYRSHCFFRTYQRCI